METAVFKQDGSDFKTRSSTTQQQEHILFNNMHVIMKNLKVFKRQHGV